MVTAEALIAVNVTSSISMYCCTQGYMSSVTIFISDYIPIR